MQLTPSNCQQSTPKLFGNHKQSSWSTPGYNAADDGIKVFVRMRPLNELEEGHAKCLRRESSSTLTLLPAVNADATEFTYDHVAAEDANQEHVFKAVGRPVIEHVLSGFNASVLAYGQTASGKTHTMLGDVPLAAHTGALPVGTGLIPRTLYYLFQRVGEESNPSYTIRCSMLELYREEMSDLLVAPVDRHKLALREDAGRGVVVDGVTWEPVATAQEALTVLRRGATHRKVGETRVNARSSRSHCVFTCWVEGRTENTVRTALLHMVDLAGSERQSAAETEGVRLKEAASINKSLMTLGLVIQKLADHGGEAGSHVPYRDSKLTHLLKESLGGNARSIVVATVSSSALCVSETANTLAFAARAGKVRNKPKVNEDKLMDYATLTKDNRRLRAELDQLRVRLIAPAPLPTETEDLQSALERVELLEESNAMLEEEIGSLRQDKVELEASKCDAMERVADLERSLKEAEIVSSEFQRLRESFASLEKAAHALKNERDSLSASVEDEIAELALVRAELTGARAELALAKEAKARMAESLIEKERGLHRVPEATSPQPHSAPPKSRQSIAIKDTSQSETMVHTVMKLEASLSKAARRHEDLQGRCEELQSEKERALAESVALSGLRDELESVMKKAAELESSVSTLNEELRHTKEELVRTRITSQREATIAAEKIAILTAQLERRQSVRASIGDISKQLRVELTKVKDDLMQAEATIALRDHSLQALQQDKTTLKTEVDNALKQVESTTNASEKRLKILEAQHASEKENHQQKVEDLERMVEDAERKYCDAQAATESLSAQVDDLQQGLYVRTQQLQAHESALTDMEEKLQAAGNDHETLSESLRLELAATKKALEERNAAVKAGEIKIARLEDELVSVRSKWLSEQELSKERDDACLALENELSTLENATEVLRQGETEALGKIQMMSQRITEMEAQTAVMSEQLESKDWRIRDQDAQISDSRDALLCANNKITDAQEELARMAAELAVKSALLSSNETALESVKIQLSEMQGKLDSTAAEAAMHETCAQNLRSQLAQVAVSTKRDAELGYAALNALKDEVKALAQHASEKDAELEQVRTDTAKAAADELESATAAHRDAIERMKTSQAQSEATAKQMIGNLKVDLENKLHFIGDLKVQLERSQKSLTAAETMHKEIATASTERCRALKLEIDAANKKSAKLLAERDAIAEALRALQTAFKDSEVRHKQKKADLEGGNLAQRQQIEMMKEDLRRTKDASVVLTQKPKADANVETEKESPQVAVPAKDMRMHGVQRPTALSVLRASQEELEPSHPVQLPLTTPIGWGFAYERRYLDENTPPPVGASPGKRQLRRGPLAARSQAFNTSHPSIGEQRQSFDDRIF